MDTLFNFFDLENDKFDNLTINNDNYIVHTQPASSTPLKTNIAEAVMACDQTYLELGVVKQVPPVTELFFDETYTSTNKSVEIYAYWDRLMAKYPTTITREEAGRDDANNPIYVYTIKAPDKRLEDVLAREANPVKILITAGIHPSERVALTGLINAMTNIVDNPTLVEHGGYLRANVEFVVVPLMVPSGRDLGRRSNVNGVDINRNFPTDWELADERPGTVYWKGPAPMSEKEPKIILDVVRKHSDAVCMINLHGHALEQQMFWFGSDTEWLNRIGNGVINHMHAIFHSNTNYYPDRQKPITYLGKNSYGGLDHHVQMHWGIPSCILELGTPPLLVGDDFLASQLMCEKFIRLSLFEIVNHYQTNLVNSLYTRRV